MTTNNPIHDLLAAPLEANWTVEDLAEQLLNVIAAQNSDDKQEFVLSEEAITDRFVV